MIKQEGRWHEVAWETALDYVGHAFADVRREHGAEAIGALVSPTATVEELYLAGALMRGIGSENVDFRLRQSDFSLDQARPGVPWLGHADRRNRVARSRCCWSALSCARTIRCLSARVRAAAKGGARVMSLHAVAQDWLMPMAARMTVAPDRWVTALIEVLVACARSKQPALPEMYCRDSPSADAHGGGARPCWVAKVCHLARQCGRAASFLWRDRPRSRRRSPC